MLLYKEEIVLVAQRMVLVWGTLIVSWTEPHRGSLVHSFTLTATSILQGQNYNGTK